MLEGGYAEMSSRHNTFSTIFVAAVLCVVCATMVSSVSVSLKDKQIQNKELDKKRNILLCAGLISPKDNNEKIKAMFKEDAAIKVEAKILDVDNGKILENFNPYTGKEDSTFVAANYDQQKATKDPNLSISVSKEQAKNSQIKRRAKYALIYLVKEEGKTTQIILPISSIGLWSTMLGFLAVDVDTTSVKGFAYYEHGETPGLGGEVDNPNWKSQWPQKKLYNENWQPKIHVIKGKVDNSAPGAEYQIDGLSGATITSNGVSSSLEYWLGDHGFGPFLQNVRKEGIQ